MVNTMNIVPIMVPAESLVSKMEEATPPQPTTPERTVTDHPIRLSMPLDASSKRVIPVYPDRKLARRDSIDRREAMLKGKEGSRQRRRWENGRLSPLEHHEWDQVEPSRPLT